MSGPLAPRPDDAQREARLRAMQRRATGLLAVVAVVFVAARWFEPLHPWLGYVRATAEASLVGGLADWFAVTALFRHPLGIPIPHTAIVAKRKDHIGRILGNFVQNHFLSREVIAANLRVVRPAGRLAQWLADPAHGKEIATQVAAGLAQTIESLPAGELESLVRGVVTTQLRAVRAAPALGKTLALVLAGERQQNLLTAAVKLAAEAVRDNGDVIREKIRAESPWWVPGVVDERIYRKILDGVEALLRDVADDPYHPMRASFDAAVYDFIDRLQHSPDTIAKADAIKEAWLADPEVLDLSNRLWTTARHAIVTYATKTGGAEPRPLERGITQFGTALAGNAQLLAELDDLFIDLASGVVEGYRVEIGDLIAQTVAGWDPDATSRRFELAVGRDLQFVRINGTIVGGLVGLAIYALSRL